MLHIHSLCFLLPPNTYITILSLIYKNFSSADRWASRSLLEGHRACQRDGVGVQERRACDHRWLLLGLPLLLEHRPVLVPGSAVMIRGVLLPVAFDPDEGPDRAPGHLVGVVDPDRLGRPHLATAMDGASPLVTLPGVLAQREGVRRPR